MHSNGVVQFVNPSTHWCCSGINLDNQSTLSSSYNYAIAVLWTDLIDNSTEGRFYTQGNENYQRYQWNNISEYYNSNRNTVGLEIRPDGSFDMYHQMINIQNHAFTIGVIGDATQGEWTQYQYTNPGGTLYNFGSSTADDRVTGWSATNNVYSYSDGTSGTTSVADPCDSDPLYSENCSGYAQAYYNQQCELDALYDSGCSGYADAYFSQQCSLDALYNEDCPGYEQAYFNQQCSLDPFVMDTSRLITNYNVLWTLYMIVDVMDTNRRTMTNNVHQIHYMTVGVLVMITHITINNAASILYMIVDVMDTKVLI
jgi:hypothetical protein